MKRYDPQFMSNGHQAEMMEQPHKTACEDFNTGKYCLAVEVETLKADHRKVVAEKDGLEELVNNICDLFKIGSKARSATTIMTNIENVLRREKCLSFIEYYLSESEIDEDGIESAESLLNWGDKPTEYIERFKKAIAKHRSKK